MTAQAAKDVFRQIGEEQADAILGEAEKFLQESGVTDSLRLVTEGDPASAILKATQESGAGMIVVGTRGLNGLRELAIGRVAHKITAASTCPVLVIK
jgi:nucleotide-binding universal stress UspA family protein